MGKEMQNTRLHAQNPHLVHVIPLFKSVLNQCQRASCAKKNKKNDGGVEGSS